MLLLALLPLLEGLLISEELSCVSPWVAAHFTPSFKLAVPAPAPLLALLLVLLVLFELLVVLLVFPDFDVVGMVVVARVVLPNVVVVTAVVVIVVARVVVVEAVVVPIVVARVVVVVASQRSSVSVQTVSLIQSSLALTRAKTSGRSSLPQPDFVIERYE